MARYKFSWTNLSPALLRELRSDFPGERDLADALRRAYGVRPSVDFVKDYWPTLLDTWLERDRASRVAVVEELRTARLGDASIPIKSASGQMEYLRSCRNSSTLRGVVRAALITSGEATSVAAGRAASPPVRSKHWQEFVTSLAATLSALEEDHYLIIQRKNQPWFVQFAAQGAYGLRAEMVSNAFLDVSEYIPTPSLVRAQQLGWSPPTNTSDESTPEKDPDGSPNYFVDWPSPVPYISASRLAVDTLVDVLEAPHPGTLTYRAFAEDGTRILLPTLGLKTEPHDAAAADGDAEVPDRDAMIDQLVELLRRVSGDSELSPDDDGDIPLAFDSAIVFVRVFNDPPIIRVFSPVLVDVRTDLDVISAVNDLNRQFALTKWMVEAGAVIAMVDLFGSPMVEQHVLHACGVVGDIANSVDEELQDRFGGRTFFGEPSSPATTRPTGGYL